MPKLARQNQAALSNPPVLGPEEVSVPPLPPGSSGPAPDAGLMVLSSSMRILHINSRARSLLALFGEARGLWPHLSPESMPAILTEFCGAVFAALHRQAGSHEWAQFEMRRVCHMVTPALLLRGFGMPSTDGRAPRMILTLQPCPPSTDPAMRRNRSDGSINASTDLSRSNH